MMAKENLLKEIKVKIKQAEIFSTKKSFPFNIFSSYDPFQAAELFQEIGDIYISVKDYRNAAIFLEKAADNYILSDDSCSKSYTGHVYNKLGDLYLNNLFDNIKACIMYNNSALYHSASGSNSLAASRKLNAAKTALSVLDYEKAEEYFKDAIEYYENCNMLNNKSLCLNDYILCLIKNEKYDIAGDVFFEIGSDRNRKAFANFNLMMSYFCYFLALKNTDDIYEMLKGEEKEIIDTLLGEEKSNFKILIEKYMHCKNPREEIIMIIEEVNKRTQPEFDIL